WRRLRICLRSGCTRDREVYLRSYARSFRSFEVSFVRLKSRDFCEKVVGELLHVSVVVAQSIVVAFALDRYAILRAREFILQAKEILIGLQLRIVLDNE